ncbi:MAG: tRNA preQ1(34) S-adenosylmethionine ribosyltransferase-isomerase QueA [Candidatus Gastranaerophilales bacterium]|nr:tRNA preQ1(34) S-adenosylmethionine ribosyltransferase-isomerase QueA [Candidatus Gastranaerophilales bacterium]
MLLSEFDYELPETLIAQTPAQKRDFSRMMVVHSGNAAIEHKHFYDIVDYINDDCVLILNNTKVIPARLYGYKDTGARIEIFLLKQIESRCWEVLIKPSKRVRPGVVIIVSDRLSVKVLKPLEDDGKWLVQLNYEGDIYGVLSEVGNVPLPPYIERKMTSDELKKLDYERYQTVYAENEGSVAAPTAGLHFTPEILEKLKAKGVEIGFVTLNVGLGTFRPVKCENILEHKMDTEEYQIPARTAEIINSAKQNGKKIIAVGTTTVRTLETAYKEFGEIKECSSSSALFIYPPYEFKVIDKLITNFHLPKSTLLMLVSALAGKECIFKAYHSAIENKYRFYSYGDCMFIDK